MSRRPAVLVLALLAVVALVLAGCTGGAVLAEQPVERPTPPPATPAPVPADDPQPVSLPLDDAPHGRLTEWWYYTGHLRDETGAWYGFEYVVFRAERGDFPVSWASHLAITDVDGGRFAYAQRAEIGPQVDLGAGAKTASPSDGGFSFLLRGLDPTRPETYDRPAWTMAGRDGRDRLAATLAADEATAAGSPGGMALDLALVSTKPPVLHDVDGWIDFGPAGGSYYYSRTAMAASGTIVLDGRPRAVEGTAWFDHQWGDFIAVGGGGWDWFAVNLDDGTDLTVSLVRDLDGSYPLVYGTLVDPAGATTHLPATAVEVEVLGTWASPRSGANYPSGWRIRVPGQSLDIVLTPTLADQELDTRATTGVIYWEGSQAVAGTRDGRPVAGRAYVELTGYAPADAQGAAGTSMPASAASARAEASSPASAASSSSIAAAAAR
jgi:predicted secreted hydrolase